MTKEIEYDVLKTFWDLTSPKRTKIVDIAAIDYWAKLHIEHKTFNIDNLIIHVFIDTRFNEFIIVTDNGIILFKKTAL